MKKISALILILCLAFSLCACSGTSESAAPESTAPESTEPEAPALVEYSFEKVGTLQLPEGGSVDEQSLTEPLPTDYAIVTVGDYSIELHRFGKEAYEAAGVPLPEDVEDYGTRANVLASIPEDSSYGYDEAGNYSCEFSDGEGNTCYVALMQGEESFGNLNVTAPEGSYNREEVLAWASAAVLK